MYNSQNLSFFTVLSSPNFIAWIQVLAVSVYNHYKRIYYESLQKWLVLYLQYIYITCLNIHPFILFFSSYIPSMCISLWFLLHMGNS
jgi:hypothetical protein